MNICILTSSYPNTPSDSKSAGVFVRDFALELVRRNNKVFLLTQAMEGKTEDDIELEVVRYNWLGKNKPLSTLNPLNPLDVLKMFSVISQGRKALMNLVRREKIDLCLAMWAVPAGYLAYYAKKRCKVPYVVWALGSDIWNYGRYPVFRTIVRKILCSAEKLYADGIQLCDGVKSLSGKNCSFLATTRLLPKQDLPEVKIEKGKTNFLFIGRYHKNKGIDILIQAISLIPAPILDGMRFHIFGGGELESLILNMLRKSKLEAYVRIGGFIETAEAAAYLNLCDCLLIPSRIESIPCVLSDALQMNTPVIVSDAGDMGQLVDRYQAGIVVSTDSALHLSRAIIRFSNEDQSKYINGVFNLSKLFDIKMSAESFLNL